MGIVKTQGYRVFDSESSNDFTTTYVGGDATPSQTAVDWAKDKAKSFAKDNLLGRDATYISDYVNPYTGKMELTGQSADWIYTQSTLSTLGTQSVTAGTCQCTGACLPVSSIDGVSVNGFTTGGGDSKYIYFENSYGISGTSFVKYENPGVYDYKKGLTGQVIYDCTGAGAYSTLASPYYVVGTSVYSSYTKMLEDVPSEIRNCVTPDCAYGGASIADFPIIGQLDVQVMISSNNNGVTSGNVQSCEDVGGDCPVIGGDPGDTGGTGTSGGDSGGTGTSGGDSGGTGTSGGDSGGTGTSGGDSGGSGGNATAGTGSGDYSTDVSSITVPAFCNGQWQSVDPSTFTCDSFGSSNPLYTAVNDAISDLKSTYLPDVSSMSCGGGYGNFTLDFGQYGSSTFNLGDYMNYFSVAGPVVFLLCCFGSVKIALS